MLTRWPRPRSRRPFGGTTLRWGIPRSPHHLEAPVLRPPIANTDLTGLLDDLLELGLVLNQLGVPGHLERTFPRRELGARAHHLGGANARRFPAPKFGLPQTFRILGAVVIELEITDHHESSLG